MAWLRVYLQWNQHFAHSETINTSVINTSPLTQSLATWNISDGCFQLKIWIMLDVIYTYDQSTVCWLIVISGWSVHTKTSQNSFLSEIWICCECLCHKFLRILEQLKIHGSVFLYTVHVRYLKVIICKHNVFGQWFIVLSSLKVKSLQENSCNVVSIAI